MKDEKINNTVSDMPDVTKKLSEVKALLSEAHKHLKRAYTAGLISVGLGLLYVGMMIGTSSAPKIKSVCAKDINKDGLADIVVTYVNNSKQAFLQRSSDGGYTSWSDVRKTLYSSVGDDSARKGVDAVVTQIEGQINSAGEKK